MQGSLWASPISFPIQILPLACTRIQHESVCLRIFYSQEKTGTAPPTQPVPAVELEVCWRESGIYSDTHASEKSECTLPFCRDMPRSTNTRPLRRARYVYQDAITLVEADSRQLSFSRLNRKSGESERENKLQAGFLQAAKEASGGRDGRG